jgi:glycine/D-amino acid oxidase-like deaminating enzyme
LGNFGLVWVQGKGQQHRPYIQWTLRSADLWPRLDAELREITGIPTDYRRPGGIHVCLTEAELEARERKLAAMAAIAGGRFTYEMMSHDETAKRLPGLGRTVAGGSYSNADGHVNPLKLLRSLHAGFRFHGGQWRRGAGIQQIEADKEGFRLTIDGQGFAAPKLVLAAGLGNRELGSLVGIDVPVRPQRGQILVTEKMAPFLSLPTATINQTDVGSVLLGASHENAGFDDGVTPPVMQAIASHACTVFPALQRKRIVRAWGALRPLMPDELPHYEASPTHPGAFVACSHSGVTLAAVHALDLAGHISDGALPSHLNPFNGDRFHARNDQDPTS